jgi:hypothetical protein
MARSSSASGGQTSGVSMDVLSLVRLVARHWRVTIPAGLLAVIVALATFRLSPPTYQATGSVVLLSPPEAPRSDGSGSGVPPEVGQNPFARYGDLSVVADIVVRVIGGDAKRAEYASQGVTDYEVVANRFQRGPVVDVTGKGSSAEAAIGSAETVLEDVNATLTELQEAEHADPDYLITGASLEPPSTAAAMYGSTVRTAIAVLAVGGLGTLALAVLAEALSRRRALRRASISDATSRSTVDPGAEPGSSDNVRGAESPGVPLNQSPQYGEPPGDEHAQPTMVPAEASMRGQRRRTTASEQSRRSPADNGHKRPTRDWNS